MSERPCWRFGDFDLDAANRSLLRNGKVVALPPKAFDILVVLVKNAGRLVSREQLFEQVWPQTSVEDANLTNNIVMLRRKLGRSSILSVPRHGYRFCLPVSLSAGLSQRAMAWMSEAQKLLSQRSSESVLRARNKLWLTIGEDPECATAWAWQARACRFLEKFGTEREYHRTLVELAFRRAFAIDPELACAHHFYTVVQVDRGEALDALPRLLAIVVEGKADAATFAALVQVCRFCGLTEVSIRAYERAKEMEAGIATSVPHTYFARCEYEAVVESYLASGQGTGIYLDLCAWACLGFEKRALEGAESRLRTGEWPPLFQMLLQSLSQALRGNAEGVRQICRSQELYEDPESAIYLARTLAFCNCREEALQFLATAVDGGLAVPEMLAGDPWLKSLRNCGEFERIAGKALQMQQQAGEVLKTFPNRSLVARKGAGT